VLSLATGELKRRLGQKIPFRTVALEHPWNKTLSLWGDFQQFPGVRAIESSVERSDHPFTKRSGDMVYTSVLD